MSTNEEQPAYVPDLKDLKPHHHELIRLAVSGYRPGEIAKQLEMSFGRVSVLLKHHKIKALIDEQRKELMGSSNAEKRMKLLANSAVDVLADIISSDNAKDADKLSAAKEILDRSYGKAKQSVAVENSLVSDLLSAINSRNTKTAVPVKQDPVMDQIAGLEQKFNAKDEEP